MTCINCGNGNIVRSGDTFTCTACKYTWTVDDEQTNTAYIITVLGRQPATVEKVVKPEPSPAPEPPKRSAKRTKKEE